jgi:bis(5'-nucleosyl)-tetraphosphatase (symmetrical)
MKLLSRNASLLFAQHQRYQLRKHRGWLYFSLAATRLTAVIVAFSYHSYIRLTVDHQQLYMHILDSAIIDRINTYHALSRSFIKNRYRQQQQQQHRLFCQPLRIPTTLCSTAKQQSLNSQVHFSQQTNIQQRDDNYEQQRPVVTIPEPKQRHIVLPPPAHNDNDVETQRSGILVIGDVHGCYDEMMLLYNKAIQENGNRLFHYVILVGDICNKGPQSMKVIRHVQENHLDWICIRGNHENSVLSAYNELQKTSSDIGARTKYRWLLGKSDDSYNNNDDTKQLLFTEEDFKWMSNLPYTIRIPANHIGLRRSDNTRNNDESNNSNSDCDTVIVHAAVIPGRTIEENDVSTMVVLRELPISDNLPVGDTSSKKNVPWASLWNGPEQIIFGHDAKRGLQQYTYATGLDTGCVYGNQLTGIILPQRKIVQVHAIRQHTPIDK